MGRVRWLALALLIALVATACADGVDGSQPAASGSGAPDGSAPDERPEAEPDPTEPDPTDWDAVRETADGATLSFYLWGGSTEIVDFVEDVYGPELAELGVELDLVPIADTADAVNAVLGELEAGRDQGGSVDVIWIDGENTATLRQADALLSGWAEQLPNAALVDWDDPSVAYDAGQPVDGDESPWGSAQFQFVHDTERHAVEQLPASYAELADWIEANPGRFTYPAPPAFHGTRLITGWFYELADDPEAWAAGFDEDAYERIAEELFAELERLEPALWRDGGTYPSDIAELDRLFANGEVDLTFTQLPAGLDGSIEAGTLPPTARPYVFDTGGIADHHYLAIPVNSSEPAAAMVLANLVLEPHLQVRKLDPAEGWGDGIAIAPDRIDDQPARTALEQLTASLGDTAVDPAVLDAARLPEATVELTTRLEDDWNRRIRQGAGG
ncbi:MAG: ABC transporter substrate-binding protein [Nitriliruptoraceae bacterium]